MQTGGALSGGTPNIPEIPYCYTKEPPFAMLWGYLYFKEYYWYSLVGDVKYSVAFFYNSHGPIAIVESSVHSITTWYPVQILFARIDRGSEGRR